MKKLSLVLLSLGLICSGSAYAHRYYNQEPTRWYWGYNYYHNHQDYRYCAKHCGYRYGPHTCHRHGLYYYCPSMKACCRAYE